MVFQSVDSNPKQERKQKSFYIYVLMLHILINTRNFAEKWDLISSTFHTDPKRIRF